MLVIGISGKIGSGKSSAAEYIAKKFSAPVLKFSDVLLEILRLLSLPEERENFQRLGKALREAFGEDIIARALRTKIEKMNSKAIVLDGVRYKSEAEFVKSFPQGYLIYIQAEPEVRYSRVVKRASRGEEEKSFSQFLQMEKADTESHFHEVKALADFVVENNSSLEELHTKLDSIIEKIQEV